MTSLTTLHILALYISHSYLNMGKVKGKTKKKVLSIREELYTPILKESQRKTRETNKHYPVSKVITETLEEKFLPDL